MDRYMILEGIRGSLVTDPHTNVAQRYIGQTKKSYEDCVAAEKFIDMFEPGTVAKKYHPHLVKAVARGSLTQHGGYVYADSPDEALASISSKPKTKPKKADNSKEKGNE